MKLETTLVVALLAAVSIGCGEEPIVPQDPESNESVPVQAASRETENERVSERADASRPAGSPDSARGSSPAPAPARAPRSEPLPTPIPTARFEGSLRNAETHEPLSFANVVLRRLGDSLLFEVMTDHTGRFAFERIPQDRYDLKVLYLGFKPIHQTVEINGDQVLPPFDAQVTVVKKFEVFDVSGDAIMVEVKNTETVQTIGSEDLVGYAVDTVEAGVGSQAGIVSRDGELHVRGGRGGEISFRIDGVNVDDPLGSMSQLPPQTEVWVIEAAESDAAKPRDGPGSGALTTIDQDGTEIPLPLRHTHVDARIDGYIANVEVEQTFHNPFEEKIEAKYVFPLPSNAAVHDFLLEVGGRTIRGIVRERAQAREIYEQAKRRGHVASLLSQERPNIFIQEVANIEPGKTVDVSLRYFNTLAYVDGWFEFVFPMVVGPRYNPPGFTGGVAAVARGRSGQSKQDTTVEYLAPNERSGHDVDLILDINAGMAIEELLSINHVVDRGSLDEAQTRVTLSPLDTIPNKDFVLRYRVAANELKPAVITQQEGPDKYFSMMLIPPAQADALPRSPVEFVFVLDCSGSMSGWPIEVAKRAMSRALTHLKPDDTFQIIRFSESASSLGAAMIPATAENVARGLQFVQSLHGSGGTRMVEGIKAALDFAHDPSRERVVSFMTDGFIGNENEIFSAVVDKVGDSRIFSFGVGTSPNRHLLEGLARYGKGAVAYITGNRDPVEVDRFYDRVRRPALTDIEIDWGAMRVSNVYPRAIHDVFVGRPLLLTGRYEGGGTTRVKVSGRMGGKTHSIELEVDLDSREQQVRALPVLWARREIEALSEAGLRSGLSPGGEITALALRHQLVSRYTSFLAVDAAEITGEEAARLVPVAIPVPQGVRYESTVSGLRR